jgi:hypothetical protein
VGTTASKLLAIQANSTNKSQVFRSIKNKLITIRHVHVGKLIPATAAAVLLLQTINALQTAAISIAVYVHLLDQSAN